MSGGVSWAHTSRRAAAGRSSRSSPCCLHWSRCVWGGIGGVMWGMDVYWMIVSASGSPLTPHISTLMTPTGHSRLHRLLGRRLVLRQARPRHLTRLVLPGHLLRLWRRLCPAHLHALPHLPLHVRARLGQPLLPGGDGPRGGGAKPLSAHLPILPLHTFCPASAHMPPPPPTAASCCATCSAFPRPSSTQTPPVRFVLDVHTGGGGTRCFGMHRSYYACMHMSRGYFSLFPPGREGSRPEGESGDSYLGLCF